MKLMRVLGLGSIFRVTGPAGVELYDMSCINDGDTVWVQVRDPLAIQLAACTLAVRCSTLLTLLCVAQSRGVSQGNKPIHGGPMTENTVRSGGLQQRQMARANGGGAALFDQTKSAVVLDR